MSTHVPPESVRSNARRGLELRAKYGRGGLSTQDAGKQGIGSGVARARDLAAGGGVSPETLRRMVAFFARHRKNKSGGEDDAGRIAWLLWGGDAGEAWAKRELAGLEKGGDAYPAGALLMPEDYLTRVRIGTMLKGLSHKYIKRVPTGKTTKTGKPRYRYYYHAAHGGTVAHSEHFVEGASFKDPEGHWHITGRDGDTVHLRHDETGKTQSMTTGELAAHLTQLHHGAIQDARERATRDLADAKASGASAKQLAALKKRAERVGVVDAAPEPPKPDRAPRPRAPAEGKLEAVGDHIWGSRKDLAQKRRIESSKDLEGMTYADAAAVVRKSRIMDPLTVDEAKMRGMTPGGAVAALAVMAAVREKPGDSKAEREAYVTEIRDLMGGLSRAKTARDVLRLAVEMREARRYEPTTVEVEKVADLSEAHKRAAELSKELDAKVGVYGSHLRRGYSLRREIPVKYDALGAGFKSLLKNPAKAIRDGLSIDATTTSPEATATAWDALRKKGVGDIKAAVEKAPKGDKKAKGPDIAEPIVRTGGVEVKDANPERVRDKFGFREVDYGKAGYMTQADREHHTKALEEATHDLVDALGIDPKHASFNGRIGIALGARGAGKAVAHYEPGRHAINITKVRGGGSFAHEWGHALDDVVARHYLPDTGKAGAMGFTNRPDSKHFPQDVRDAVARVMDAMNKPADPAAARAKYDAERQRLDGAVRDLGQKHSAVAAEVAKLKAMPKDAEERERRAKSQEQLAAYSRAEAEDLAARAGRSKVMAGRVSDARYREKVHAQRAEAIRSGPLASADDLAKLQALEGEAEKLRTDYNEAAKRADDHRKIDPNTSEFRMNSKGAYLGSNHEMFARAFESFVSDELAAKGRRNTYLAGDHQEFGDEYPKGDERKNINRAMRNLVDVLTKGGHLAKALAGPLFKGTPNGSLESPGLDAASPAPGVVLPPRAHRPLFPFAGYMNFRGLPIHIENLRGSVRQGVDPSGKPWSVTMAHHYGEIESTEGADGDPLDVYVGPDVGSDVVVVVRQVDPDTRAFDEHKAMLGFASVNAALRAYRDQYNRPGFYGGHTTMTLDAFPAWIAKNANKAEAPTDEPTLGNLTAALL